MHDHPTSMQGKYILMVNFLRKDLSMKSDTDMACILGKRQHKREDRCDKKFVLVSIVQYIKLN